jgi:hypothetical protein
LPVAALAHFVTPPSERAEAPRCALHSTKGPQPIDGPARSAGYCRRAVDFSRCIKEKTLMSQNLVTLNISPDDLAAIAAAITTLQEKLGGLIELSVDQRRSLTKMGDKSEAFCRQTLIVLAQNKQIIPPELDLAEAERDLHNLDLLRPHLASLRQLVAKADDTEMALGSDILTAALEGYALAKVFGKGAGLDALKEAMAARYSRKRHPTPVATA